MARSIYKTDRQGNTLHVVNDAGEKEPVKVKNWENIQAANDARAKKQEMLNAKSERQRKINYRLYNETNNHVLRPKAVRQAVTKLLSMSKVELDETLKLVKELSQ